MIEFKKINFTYTTAEEENKHFLGPIHDSILYEVESNLPVGNYRVIDGQMCRIDSFLSSEDLKKKFENLNK
jgi:hypothetical protein